MHKLSGKQLNAAFLEGKYTAVEIVSHFLKRIDTFDPQIGAFLVVFHERALEKARQLDKKKASQGKLGRLAGVPIAVKDNIHVKGELSTCGSKFLTNYRAVFDATAIKLIEEEDGIIIGKTNLDEFAMGSSNENSALQVTRNPWDLTRVPGGSSGGSAAAVAARLCPIALGSDTGGSVRQPAALSGIVGFKPTYGRISRFGLVAYGSSLDQIGPFATSVEDIGLMMEVLGRHDPHDSTSLSHHTDDYLPLFDGKIEGRKIGVPVAFLADLQEEPKRHFYKALEQLEKCGCTIVEIDLSILKYSIATYYIVATAEASTNLARFDGIRYGHRSARAKTLEQVYDYSKREGFGAEVRRRILLGTYVLSAGYQDAYYKQAGRVRGKIIEAFNTAFEHCDVIATPTSPLAAFPIGSIQDPLQMYLQDIYTIGVNLAYLPGISVPCGFAEPKLPLGLQLIGQRREDPLVCRIADAYEKATRFTEEIPQAYG